MTDSQICELNALHAHNIRLSKQYSFILNLQDDQRSYLSEGPKKLLQSQERRHSPMARSVNQDAHDELEAKKEEFYVAEMPTLVRHASDSILLTYNQDAHDQLEAEQEELYVPEMPTLNRYVSDAVLLTYNLDAHDQLEAKKEEYVRQFSTCSLLEPLPLHYLGGLASIMMPPKLAKGNTHLPAPTKYSRRPKMVLKSSH